MSTVQVFTKERMLAIENATVISGTVDVDGNLILKRKDNSTYNAGKVYPISATTDVQGLVEIATNLEVTTGTDVTRVVTPSGLAALTATQSRRGLIQIATDAETIAGSETVKAVTPSNLAYNRAMTRATGVVSDIWSSGYPKVTLDTNLPDGTSSVTAYISPTSNDVQPGASVALEKFGSSWYIVSATNTKKLKFMKQVPIQPQNGFTLYSERGDSDPAHAYGNGRTAGQAYSLGPTAGSAASGPFYATMTGSGIVNVVGLLGPALGFSWPSGTLIGTLPVGMRPTRVQVFTTYDSGGGCNIVVRPDGTIRCMGFSGTAYVSLNNIRFRAKSAVDAGLANFVAATLSTANVENLNIDPLSGSASPTDCGYTIDSEGIVVFEGIVRFKVAMAAATAPMQFTGLGTQLSWHHAAWDDQRVMFWRFGNQTNAASTPGNYMSLGVATTANERMSLANAMIVDTTSSLVWGALGQNGWIPYDNASYTAPGLTRSTDGLIISRGLWKSGTVAQTAGIVVLPSDWSPRHIQIIMAMSNSARSRLDVAPHLNTKMANYPGAISSVNGSSSWLSMDGLSWPAWDLKDGR